MPDPNAHPHQILALSLGGEEYAAPLARVQEVIDFEAPHSVGSGVPWLRGVINLRGKIVPVCDLAARLGVDGGAGERKIVIVEAADDLGGVIVDAVSEVLTVPATGLEDAAGPGGDLVQGVAWAGDRVLPVLNLDGVFATPAPAAFAMRPTAA